jgi:hypothetical protein
MMLAGRAEPIDEQEHGRLAKRATSGEAVVTLGGPPR